MGVFNAQLAELARQYNDQIRLAGTGLAVAAVVIGSIASIASACAPAGGSSNR